MNTWKKHKVILLPSRNGGRIGYNHTRLSENKLYYYHQGAVHSEAKHLHILSNEVPEIVNTPIYVEGVGIGRLTEEHGELCAYVPGGDGIGSMTFPFPRNFKNKVKMIIASTDKSLGVPGIPESFLKEFCERGGMDEVMVEYIKDGFKLKETDSGWKRDENDYLVFLKVSDYNEISIKTVKETWTRDELPNLKDISERMKRARRIIKESSAGEWNVLDTTDLDKWIEQNL